MPGIVLGSEDTIVKESKEVCFYILGAKGQKTYRSIFKNKEESFKYDKGYREYRIG